MGFSYIICLLLIPLLQRPSFMAIGANGSERGEEYQGGPQADRRAIRITPSDRRGQRSRLFVRLMLVFTQTPNMNYYVRSSTRHHSYPATHRTIRGYNDKGTMSFTGHIHPQAPQRDNLYVYSGNLDSGDSKDAGSDANEPEHGGDVEGNVEGTIVYQSGLPSKRFDKSRFVRRKSTSFRAFFLFILDIVSK